MTDITIPPAALEAGCSAYTAVIYRGNGTQAEFREAIRAAFVAMVAAWPGMDTIMLPRMMQPGHFVPQDYIRLPLTENPDDKA